MNNIWIRILKIEEWSNQIFYRSKIWFMVRVEMMRFYGDALNTLFSFQTIIPLRARRSLFTSLRIRKVSLNVVAGVLCPLVHLLPRTMLSRPRGLRLLYISLAATALLGLYWLASSEDGAVIREFRQPSPLQQQQQDYKGRGQFINETTFAVFQK